MAQTSRIFIIGNQRNLANRRALRYQIYP